MQFNYAYLDYGFDSVTIPDFLLKKFAGRHLHADELIVCGLIHEGSQDGVHVYISGNEGITCIHKWLPGSEISMIQIIIDGLVNLGVVEIKPDGFGRAGYRIAQRHVRPKSEGFA
tara:strand:+ start:201 stop:545 length:345 start_codon:yes stop_codon:yes gene_type:complete